MYLVNWRPLLSLYALQTKFRFRFMWLMPWLCSFLSMCLFAYRVKNALCWSHQGRSGGTKPPYQTLMLSLSFRDKDLQPARDNCQKLLAFTSEFLGLVYVCEPWDRLACGARPRTNRLWHRLRALNFKATFYYMHVYVRVCGRVAWTQCFVARCITLRSQRCQSDDK